MLRGNDSRNYQYSLFSCPVCGNEVIKKSKDGLKSRCCSHACYAKTRSRRGPYKQSVLISGYRYLQRPDHPACGKKGYVAEHRLVAEEQLGRLLEASEVVHHINHDKLDNRPENLQVMTGSEHMRHHKEHAKRGEDGKFTV
jgi:hypothetical protein